MKKLNYEETVEYILQVPKFTKKNPVNHIKALMKELGEPQNNMKVIHVAGTNGKGSVCAYLASILGQANKTYAMFTSPHLVQINERFIINNTMVSNDDFTDAFQEVMTAVESIMKQGYQHPTFFELLFAMAMVIFNKKKVEFAILETGMGGRLDATNMIEKPVLTIITTIGLDHTQILGDTIEKIAFEKAGIIKSQVPVIFDGTNQASAKVIEAVAKEKNCEYYKLVESNLFQLCNKNEFCYEILRFDNKYIDFLFKYGYYGCIKVFLGMIGEYQIKNSSLAIRAIQVLKEGINNNDILEGIKKTKWPGRMQMLLPKVYLDGAHNPIGIQEFIKTVMHFGNCRKVLLFSAVFEKDYKSMIRNICKNLQFDAIVVTLLNNKRAVAIDELQDEFQKNANCKVYAIKDMKEAFNKMIHLKTDEGMGFCVGSLYLVGEITEIVRRIEND